MNYFPKKCTLRTAFTYYLHLNAVTKKKLLKGLALYAKDEQEKKELTLLASNTEEGKKFYQQFIKEANKDPLEILNHYKSVDIPLGLFLELMPRLQPRYYSIASSSLNSPDVIRVIVAVVTYQTTTGKTVKGICSNFIQSLKVDSKANIFVRRSTFHLPEDSTKPVIMVGPGTGSAPFIGFIEQRLCLQNKGKKLGECLFYFGCRKKKEDYIFEELMENADSKGVIKLSVAFSRDTEKKCYVQHKLIEDEEKVWNILTNGGIFYICGDAKYMAKDVDKVLIEIATKYLKDEKKGIEFIEELSRQNRYLKDVWSP